MTQNMKPHIHLPNTMSGLLTAAIKDAEELDREKYIPNNAVWHAPQENGSCHVSFAGAVLARTFGIDSRSHGTGSMLRDDSFFKAMALSAMSNGNMRLAARYMAPYLPTSPDYADLEKARAEVRRMRYGNWREFDLHVKSLKKVRDVLQRAGL